MAGLVRTGARHQRAARRAGEGGKRTEYLAFTLAGEAYAVQIAFIAEILKPPPITEVPRAPRNILGVVSVRGKLVTVVDLRRRFQLAESPIDRKSRILLTDLGLGEQIGLLVDEVLQVYRLAESELEAASALGGDQPAHIAGIGRPPGQLLVLLDLRPILET
ncbi:MAG: chemotaxis protein CheW [Myxococcales bacterium]|jgi:purine-binding chemotaxis protein CheW